MEWMIKTFFRRRVMEPVCCGQETPVGPKMWCDLDVEEKIERIRENVKSIQARLDRQPYIDYSDIEAFRQFGQTLTEHKHNKEGNVVLKDKSYF
jgi:hypothetical protein